MIPSPLRQGAESRSHQLGDTRSLGCQGGHGLAGRRSLLGRPSESLQALRDLFAPQLVRCGSSPGPVPYPLERAIRLCPSVPGPVSGRSCCRSQGPGTEHADPPTGWLVSGRMVTTPSRWQAPPWAPHQRPPAPVRRPPARNRCRTRTRSGNPHAPRGEGAWLPRPQCGRRGRGAMTAEPHSPDIDHEPGRPRCCNGARQLGDHRFPLAAATRAAYRLVWPPRHA